MRTILCAFFLLLALAGSAQAATVAELVYDQAVLHRRLDGPVTGSLPNRTISGERVHLLVLNTAQDAQGRDWLRVRLPSRPNDAKAWVLAERFQLLSTGYRVVIDRSARRLTVLSQGKRLFSSRVVVGAPETPTPLGRFALWDRYRPGRSSPLHPWVLELTAHSDVLQEFMGGGGRVAMHGMQGSLSVPLGSAVSHGCVRMRGRTVRWLARNLILGTPVTVVA